MGTVIVALKIDKKTKDLAGVFGVFSSTDQLKNALAVKVAPIQNQSKPLGERMDNASKETGKSYADYAGTDFKFFEAPVDDYANLLENCSEIKI